jgi:hypothetical protein
VCILWSRYRGVVAPSQRGTILAYMLFRVSSFEIVLSINHIHQVIPTKGIKQKKERKKGTGEIKTPSVVIVIITHFARGSCYAMFCCRTVASRHRPLISSFMCSSSPCLCATALLKALTTSSGTVSQSKLLVYTSAALGPLASLILPSVSARFGRRL